ncbi:nephrin-like [Penaeus monodon]|uniref:nephrin-like n=1 Tax=Penaeus monodon TaxID=6687 RepID=UPI0018A7AD91|nr:nephrin-like [Penaeus monodon]
MYNVCVICTIERGWKGRHTRSWEQQAGSWICGAAKIQFMAYYVEDEYIFFMQLLFAVPSALKAQSILNAPKRMVFTISVFIGAVKELTVLITEIGTLILCRKLELMFIHPPIRFPAGSPGRPVLEVDSRGKLVTGSILELTCATQGGFPPPEIQLFKGGAQLEVSVKQRGNATRARAALKVAPADNGAEVRCLVSNAATPEPLADAATISLLFPPWKATAWAQPAQVKEGAATVLLCETSSSLPAAAVTWRSDGEMLPGALTRHPPGRFGGTVARSELKVTASARDNGRRFTCEADNGLGVLVTANVTLDVLRRFSLVLLLLLLSVSFSFCRIGNYLKS